MKRDVSQQNHLLVRFKSRHTKNKGKRYYNKEIGIIYVNFLKALLHNELNLECSKFKCYADILEYLQKFSKDITFSKNYISQLKTRGGKFNKVPLSPQSLDFVKYVLKTYPEFKGSEFIHYPCASYEIQVNITGDISKGMEFSKSKPKRVWLNERVSMKETKFLDILSYMAAYFLIFIPYFGLVFLYFTLEGCFAPLDILTKECAIFKDDTYSTLLPCGHKFTASLFNEMQLSEIGFFGDTEDLEADSTVEIYPGTAVEYITPYPTDQELSAQETIKNKVKKRNFHSFFSMFDFNNMAYPYPSDQDQLAKATNKLSSESYNTSSLISDIISFKDPILIDSTLKDCSAASQPKDILSNHKNSTLNLHTECASYTHNKNKFQVMKAATSKEWYLNYIAENTWHNILSYNISNKNSFTDINNIKNYSLDYLINKSANKQINISVTDFLRILSNFSSINKDNLQLINLILTENYMDSYYNSNTSLINPSRSEHHVSAFIKNNLALHTSLPSLNSNGLNSNNNLLVPSSSPVISQGSPLLQVSPLITDNNPMPNQSAISDIIKWRNDIWKSRNRDFNYNVSHH